MPDRPAWLVQGARVADLARGETGVVQGVEPPTMPGFASTDATVFVLPLGGGIGWEADPADLRPAGKAMR
ncbi:hypothetical protein CK485_04310 [Streptomyces sp. ICBB 8177]|nr:hypothetical protein CK485_04310 [Streptomyces sp. ICBB 8177]